jgi:hypothetical protein
MQLSEEQILDELDENQKSFYVASKAIVEKDTQPLPESEPGVLASVIVDDLERYARTRIENRALREWVKEHQWDTKVMHHDGISLLCRNCSSCGNGESEGHAPDCRTAKLLEGK